MSYCRLPLVYLFLCHLALIGHPAFAWDDRPTAPSPEHAPHALLENENLLAWIALPAASGAFYAGRRFETAGAVAFLRAGKHSYVGWHAPRNGGLTLGLSGEFSDVIPVRDGEALKIGVGLVRGDEPQTLELLEPFPWKTSLTAHSAQFTQEAKVGSVGYRLIKTTAMEGAALHISYELKNTGSTAWSTRHYGHNFLAPGGMAAGPGMVIEFGQDLSDRVAGLRPALGASYDGRVVTFEPPEVVDEASLRLDFSGENLPTTTRLINTHNRATLEMTTSWQPTFYRLYATWREVCPEPFLSISLAPGASVAWSTTYRFFDAANTASQGQTSPLSPPTP